MPQIKTIIKYTAIIFGSEKVVKEFKSSEELYDMKGNLLFLKVLSEKGYTESLHSYEYDKQSRLIEKIYSLNDEISEKTSYRYNAAGKLIEEIISYQDGSLERKYLEIEGPIEKWTIRDEADAYEGSKDIIYNEQGLEMAKIIRDDRKLVIFDERRERDGEGRETSYKLIEYGEISTHALYEYDDENRLSKETFLNIFGSVEKQISYSYNERGQCILEEDDRLLIKNYYNEDGLLERTEGILLNGKMIDSFNEYSYNEFDLIIEESTFKMGLEYDMEPGVSSRTGSEHRKIRYEYEFWDEALVYAPST